MLLFKFESMSPFPDSDIKGEAIGITATLIENDPTLQPLAKEFLLSVNTDTVTVESMRSDGVLMYATLRFDGEQFTLIQQGVR